MHLKLTVFQFTTKEDTDKALAHYYAQADPKSGITNAWDFLIGQENFLYYLHGDCTFSTGAFTAIANELKKIMHNTGSPSKEYILCKCGGGCIRQ